ncbi:MAG: M48 family metallopeptidase [Ignavibacteriales bacterium]|nr:M48 family metallopeptidase [Ignavibacteriales bacterium]
MLGSGQPKNIYEQQAHNKKLTAFVMAGFIVFLAFLGFGFDAYLFGGMDTGTFVPLGTLTAVFVGSASAAWSLGSGAKAVLSSANAVPADGNNPAHQLLLNVVDEMSIASGLPRPKVYVVPDDDPNAFATGKDPNNSHIAVTEGLLKTLNREELQGVVAHEMSHIRNYDIRLMTVVAALLGSILLLSDWARRSMWYGGRSRNSRSRSGGQLGGVLFVLWIVGILLAPLIGQLMAMLVSRRREFLADASAAEMTRNPLGLANALKKLENASSPTASIKRGAAHLCIVDPLGKSVNLKEGAVAELFGTHPPIQKRVLALQAMAYQITSAMPAA